MPNKWDATNPEHFELMFETDGQLRARGLQDEDIAALREAQWNAPAATDAEGVKRQLSQPKQGAKKQDEAK